MQVFKTTIKPISQFFAACGLLYLCLLPVNHLHRNTYISENALMPDYVVRDPVFYSFNSRPVLNIPKILGD